MKKIKVYLSAIMVLLALSSINAQQSLGGVSATLPVPELSAEFAMGFNYDYIKSPLRVSFDYPKGYFGMNVPLKYSMPKALAQDLIGPSLGSFADSGDGFDPRLAAKQAPNTTIKVDVPMLGGVLSFSYMTMMNLTFQDYLIMPGIKVSTAGDATADMSLLLRGFMSVPTELGISWNQLTFSYAYRINDNLALSLSLHRHTFNFDFKGNVDIDLLGSYSVNAGSYAMTGDMNYSLHNTMDGHYDLTKFTPTFGIKFWRLSLVSRLGMKTNPKGYISVDYKVPFFVDPDDFSMDNVTDQTYLINNLENFTSNATTSVRYYSTKSLYWELPQSHTVMFDIIPEKLSISYTKLFGNIAMSLEDPYADLNRYNEDKTVKDSSNYPDTLNFDFKASVDHVIVLEGNFYNAFFNLGIMSLDFTVGDNNSILSNAEGFPLPKFGNGVMIPILNFGVLFGSKIQVLAELDVLPLIALKTGLVYYF